jgi:hypothetical protein
MPAIEKSAGGVPVETATTVMRCINLSSRSVSSVGRGKMRDFTRECDYTVTLPYAAAKQATVRYKCRL